MPVEKWARNLRDELLSASVPVGAGFGLHQQPSATSPNAAKRLNVVCVGGHPDDPESGCGGTLARDSSRGHNLTIIYLTRGEHGIKGKTRAEAAEIRTNEALSACKILGANPIFVGQINGDTEITMLASTSSTAFFCHNNPDLGASRIGRLIHISTIARASNLTYEPAEAIKSMRSLMTR